MVDEDLLNTDLVITGREGFSVNLDSREWQMGKLMKQVSVTLLMLGSWVIVVAIVPGVIELVRVILSNEPRYVLSLVGLGIIAAGLLLSQRSERIINDYISARVKVMEDAGELIK